jgi:hypothetical protein
MAANRSSHGNALFKTQTCRSDGLLYFSLKLETASCKVFLFLLFWHAVRIVGGLDP